VLIVTWFERYLSKGGDHFMSVKRIQAGSLFLVATFLGASTKSGLWDGFPFWVWLIVLLIAFGMGCEAVEMWRSSAPKHEEDKPD
jgi:hypothetical protein